MNTTEKDKDLFSEMSKKWEGFKAENKFVLFEYPKSRAADAAIESILAPSNIQKREKALVEIARLETTEEILKKVAALFGECR